MNVQPKRERIEWCDIWITDAEKEGVPRVLLIGDSITRGYYGEVEKLLAGRAHCARLTTSRCVSDPVFFDELSLVLSSTHSESSTTCLALSRSMPIITPETGPTSTERARRRKASPWRRLYGSESKVESISLNLAALGVTH